MSERMIKINNKSVQLKEPYAAASTELVGRRAEMNSILAAWMAFDDVLPSYPLLQGEPGIGKNKLVYESSRACGKELYIDQGHEDFGADDLVCTTRPSDDPEKRLDYILTSLTTAMVRGAVAFVDEIAKIRHKALAPLASLLEERGYIDSNLLGERIYAQPGFRFIAATNTSDLERDRLPDFIKSRVQPVITIRYPSREETEKIVRTRYRVLQENGRVLFSCFWDLWKEKSDDKPPNPRDSLYIFGHAIKLANLIETEQTHPYVLEYHGPARPVQKSHLEAAFELFSDGGLRHES